MRTIAISSDNFQTFDSFMIANDIIKDKGSVFFDPISLVRLTQKSEMMPHTKVARKGYLWPYSLTSSWTGTMMH
jgi:hypothetical protein